MKLAYISIIVTLLCGLASTASAGAYLDAGLGLALQQCDRCNADIDAGFGGKIAAGYRFNTHFAAEIGYAGGGGTWNASTGEEIGMNTSTGFGAVVGILPISDTLEVFARLGYGRSMTGLVTNEGNFKSRAETGPVYGFGVGYRQPDTIVTLRLEYNHFSSDSTMELNSSGIIGPNALDMLTLDVVFGF